MTTQDEQQTLASLVELLAWTVSLPSALLQHMGPVDSPWRGNTVMGVMVAKAFEEAEAEAVAEAEAAAGGDSGGSRGGSSTTELLHFSVRDVSHTCACVYTPHARCYLCASAGFEHGCGGQRQRRHLGL